MSAPSNTKWLGEQPQIPVREQESVTLADATLSSADVHQVDWEISELASGDEPSEKLSSEEREEYGDAVLQNRIALTFLIVLAADAVPCDKERNQRDTC